MNETATNQNRDPKPFGYVCKSKTQSSYPWLNARDWSDANGSCGNMRRHICDATLWKTEKGASQYSACDMVPVYSDPHTNGEQSLNPAAPRALSTVTIVSIWSKAPEIGRYSNVIYNVTVVTRDTPTATLEAAFCLTNQDDRPMGNRVCSTTAGDIMILNGEHYLVAGSGYTKLTLAESEAIQKLTSRDTSFGYDFMVKHNILKV